MSDETAARQPPIVTADTLKTSPHDPARPGRDSHLENAFERLLGHQATPQERAQLSHVRDSLGLNHNDALWDVLIALQYYYSLYERFPAMIRGAAHELLTECKRESVQNIAHAKQQVQHTLQHQAGIAAIEVAQAAVAAQTSLEKTIQQSARRIALAAGFAARWPWVLGSVTAVALALILTGAVALSFGRQQGYAAGYTEGYAVAMHPQQTSTVPLARGR